MPIIIILFYQQNKVLMKMTIIRCINNCIIQYKFQFLVQDISLNLIGQKKKDTQ